MEDHDSFLHTLSTLPKPLESVPINALVRIKGMHLEGNKKVSFDSFLRVVVTARGLMPGSIVRLAAKRINLIEEQQVLALFAGANAVFTGESMLTTECSGFEADRKLFEKRRLANMKAFRGEEKEGAEAVVEAKGSEKVGRLSRGTPGKVLNVAETPTVLSAYPPTVPYNIR